MKLKEEEEKILRRYISIVEGIIKKYIPSTVPGDREYKRMIEYLDYTNKVKTLLDPPTKAKKWRQMDLEEQIKEEGKKGKYNNEL